MNNKQSVTISYKSPYVKEPGTVFPVMRVVFSSEQVIEGAYDPGAAISFAPTKIHIWKSTLIGTDSVRLSKEDMLEVIEWCKKEKWL